MEGITSDVCDLNNSKQFFTNIFSHESGRFCHFFFPPFLRWFVTQSFDLLLNQTLHPQKKTNKHILVLTGEVGYHSATIKKNPTEWIQEDPQVTSTDLSKNYAYSSINLDKRTWIWAQDCCVLHRESSQNGINSSWWIAVYKFIPNDPSDVGLVTYQPVRVWV